MKYRFNFSPTHILNMFYAFLTVSEEYYKYCTWKSSIWITYIVISDMFWPRLTQTYHPSSVPAHFDKFINVSIKYYDFNSYLSAFCKEMRVLRRPSHNYFRKRKYLSFQQRCCFYFGNALFSDCKYKYVYICVLKCITLSWKLTENKHVCL